MVSLNSIGSFFQSVTGTPLPLPQSFTEIQNSFNKYIVRPINNFGLAGFIFDVEDDTTLSLSSDITDHYTEDNAAVQDHWAIKPVKLTLKNYVGELVYRTNDEGERPEQQLAQKLTVLNNYLPQISRAAEQVKKLLDPVNINFNTISALTTTTGANLWGLTKNINPAQSRQERAFRFFEALQEQKILVSVQTPYKYLASMAIESVTAKQAGESKDISNFSITLKQIRTVSTRRIQNPQLSSVGPNQPQVPASTGNPQDYQGSTNYQREREVNQGITQGAVVPAGTLEEQFERNFPQLDDEG